MLRRIVREKKGLLSCARRHASADSNLRAQPWSFGENTAAFQQTQSRTTVARFNLDMAAKLDIGQVSACFSLAADMKQQGMAPTISTYNTLLRGLARGGYASASFAVLEDMLALNISPTATSFNHIIDAHRAESSSLLPVILTKMETLGIRPNATTFSILIARFVAEENLELALQQYHAMKTHNLVPDVAAAQSLIILAAEQGYPRLAVDLAVAFENESVRKVQDSVWLACLHSSAAALYAEGVSKSWYILVSDLAISPDEGLCTLVLHTAARNGLPDLATDALRVLKVLDVPWMEYHLAPLFEAFCRAGRYPEAFSTLSVMRQNSIEPTTQTAFPVVEVVQQQPEIIDQLWETLERLKAQGRPVDISACTALLQASVSAHPLSRALADYNNLKSWGFASNADAFHIFIDGCISAGNTVYGEMAFKQIKEDETPLGPDVFGKMITLHLTQDTYDDAFLYLEEMQSANHVPAPRLYEALAVKCATAGDPRYLVALDEMKEVGHTVAPEFSLYCSQLNEAAAAKARAEALRQVGSMGGSAQKFIETGGLSGLDK
ncbi:hypothetical protein C8R47DRAFT_1052915 [Mycena vitilis]|nr:hypothetical protein C8R47DRAFT_1052915 [Mycena vitilis]